MSTSKMQRRGSLPGYVVREPPPSENATEETQVLATEEPKSAEVVELARFRAVGDRMVSVSTSKATRADGSRTMVDLKPSALQLGAWGLAGNCQ